MSIDLEHLCATIRRRLAVHTQDRVARSIGIGSKALRAWLAGAVPDMGRQALAADWLARGAPVDAPGPVFAGRVPKAVRDDLTARVLAAIEASGAQRAQVARAIGVPPETVRAWQHSRCGVTSATVALVRAWLAAGCPVGPVARPGQSPDAPPSRTADELVAAGLADPDVRWTTVEERVGLSQSQIRVIARRHGLRIPRRSALGRPERPKREQPAPKGPTAEQVAWLCSTGLPVVGFGAETIEGTMAAPHARRLVRAGYLEEVAPRRFALTEAGRAIVAAARRKAERAALGWEADA